MTFLVAGLLAAAYAAGSVALSCHSEKLHVLVTRPLPGAQIKFVLASEALTTIGMFVALLHRNTPDLAVTWLLAAAYAALLGWLCVGRYSTNFEATKRRLAALWAVFAALFVAVGVVFSLQPRSATPWRLALVWLHVAWHRVGLDGYYTTQMYKLPDPARASTSFL